VTLHIVLGNGEMTAKELTETLNDIYWKASEADDAFWLIVQGKSEPTATDEALMKWVGTNEVYFEVLTDDADAMDDIYSNAQATHTVKQLGKKVISLLNNSPDEGEEADILALFASTDPEATEDEWLNTVLGDAADAGFTAYALNDGMIEVEMGEAAAAAEAEEEDEAPKPAKAAAKKTAAKKAAAVEPEPEEEDDEPAAYTREELEDLDLKALKEVAAKQGIELPSRTRPKTYIDAILGEGKAGTPEAEIEEPTVIPSPITGAPVNTNGATYNVESLALAAAQIVLAKIADALTESLAE
jgi:hypothetical protein